RLTHVNAWPVAANGFRPFAKLFRKPVVVRRSCAQSGGERQISLFDIIAHHAIAREGGGQHRHAPAYAREPGPRQALPVPIVKFRNDLAFQKIVEAFGVASVDLRCLATPFVANRPPEPRLESLVPPTV